MSVGIPNTFDTSDRRIILEELDFYVHLTLNSAWKIYHANHGFGSATNILALPTHISFVPGIGPL